jgi:hypothetical protein
LQTKVLYDFCKMWRNSGFYEKNFRKEKEFLV